MNDYPETEITYRISKLTDEDLIRMVEDSENHTIEILKIAGVEMANRNIGAACINHPTSVAISKCHSCGALMCALCVFPISDSARLCPDCIMQESSGEDESSDSGELSEHLVGKMCTNHPTSQAVVFCILCGAPICETCDFVFAGNVHVCPACTEKPRHELSAKRRKKLT